MAQRRCASHICFRGEDRVLARPLLSLLSFFPSTPLFHSHQITVSPPTTTTTPPVFFSYTLLPYYQQSSFSPSHHLPSHRPFPANILFPHLVKIRLHPLGSAPPLTSRVFKISASNRFESVVLFLRRKLGLQSHEGVVCYVNSVFAPGLDEGVGGLWRVSVSFSCCNLLEGAWSWGSCGLTRDGGR